MIVNRRLNVEIDNRQMTLVVKSLGTGLCVMEYKGWYSLTHMASGKFIHQSKSESRCLYIGQQISDLLDWTQPEQEILKHSDLIIQTIGAINYVTTLN